MSKDEISKALGLTPLSEIREEEIKDVVEVHEPEIVQIEKGELQGTEQENLNDIELARQNVQNIIEMGDDAVREMVEIAKQSESPRAFEVVSTLMKTLLDANKDFVDLSTKKKYAQEDKPQNETNVTNNNLIVSTADLLKMLKDDDG